MAHAGGDGDPGLEVAGGDPAGDHLGLLQRPGQAVAEAVGHDQGHGECGRGSDGEPDAGIADPARCVPGEHHHQVGHIGHLYLRGEQVGGVGQAPPVPGDGEADEEVAYVQLVDRQAARQGIARAQQVVQA